MARQGFRPSREGYREVLNCDEMFGVCDRAAANLAASLGAGYTYDTIKGKNRIHAQTKTTGGGFWKEVKSHALRNTPPSMP